MRPVLPGDLDNCARALLALPVSGRVDRMAQIIEAADLADRFRKRTGRMHPHLGDGSLGVAARQSGLAVRPPSCDMDYCSALSTVLETLNNWREVSARQGGHQRR